MVAINAVRASNAALKATGAPAFIKYANSPKAYIIGRSESATGRLLKDLRLSNPSATLNFLEGEISLIREVDRLCDEIKRKEEKVDFVFLSAGYLSFDGRNEKSIDLDDLEVKQDFTMIKAAGSGTTQTTLAFEELARSNSRITFIHKYPGFVDTGAVGRLMSSTTGVYSIPATFFRWCKVPTCRRERGASPGVEPPAGVDIARSSAVDGNGSSNGVYRLKADDESAPDGNVLPDYRKNNAGRVVWESTMRVWERALEKA
ncbi:short-chain dehydrogenase reductase [Botrytis cinerea]